MAAVSHYDQQADPAVGYRGPRVDTRYHFGPVPGMMEASAAGAVSTSYAHASNNRFRFTQGGGKSSA